LIQYIADKARGAILWLYFFQAQHDTFNVHAFLCHIGVPDISDKFSVINIHAGKKNNEY